MNIIVMGHRQHGKGTFCEYAEKAFGIESISSSMMAANLFLFEQLKDKYGYTTVEECFNDRDDKRAEWYEAILAFNTPDLTALGTAIFNEYPIYDGIRAKPEFDELKAKGLVDLVIWIDASKRMPLEPSTSITVTKDDADLIIDNNGTPEAFHKKIHNVIAMISSAQLHTLM